MLVVVVVVLLVRADRARASCPVALDGDAELVARIQVALADFLDDAAPCVALRVTCGLTGGELTLELMDELGRSAHRTFATPDGAAAFVISWSRRPLPFDGIALGQADGNGLLSVQLPVEPPPDPLHGEFHFAYIRSLAGDQTSMNAMAALIRSDGIWRYGGDLRLLGAPMRYDQNMLPVLWVSSDAEAVAGAEWAWRDRIRLRGLIVAGASYATMLAASDAPSVQTVAVHAGGRATVASRLASAIWLEAGLDWDAVQAHTTRQDTSPLHEPPGDPFLHPLRFEIGLQWAP